MKKFFATALLLTAILIGNVHAEASFNPSEAPAEINHPDSIYYEHPDFYNMTSTDNRIILTHYPTHQ